MAATGYKLRLTDDHRYFVGEREYAGVTSTIRTICPGWQAGEWYMQRGRAVHAAIHLHLQNKLDWSSVDERIKGRVEAVLRFLSDCNMTVLETETQLCHGAYQYAGTVDAVLGDSSTSIVIADWKGSLDPVCCDPQLGAYSMLLLEERDCLAQRAVAVETHDDGSYKLRWGSRNPKRDKAQFSLPEAENVFRAMLTVRGHMQKHNKPQRTTNEGRANRVPLHERRDC